jgi:5-methylcytosine-specific restriction endonuclease McrA
MKRVSGKKPRVRLDRENYGQLQRQVLERDGWHCQWCGSMRHLEVHHQVFRSQSGSDEEPNLITLCAPCHAMAHRKASRCKTRLR